MNLHRLPGIFVLVLLAGTLHAQVRGPLYIVDGEFDTGQASTLHRIDPDSGAVIETIGDTGENLVAIAGSGPDGTIYGVTSADSANPQALVRIDPVTADTEMIAPLMSPGGIDILTVEDMFHAGVTLLSDNPVLIVQVEVASGQQVMSLDVTDGGMILLESNQPLIDGDAALAAGSGFPVPANAAMFGCGTTGASRLTPFMFTFGIPDPPIPTMDYPLSDATCIIAGSRGSDGSYYGVGTTFGEGVSRSLMRIDVDDATATPVDIGALPDNTSGIAFGPVPFEPVPALGRGGLAVLLLVVLAAGLAALRRVGGISAV